MKYMNLGDSTYLFSIEDRPLAYRSIQYQNNKALKLVGLYGKVGSTHFLRHSAATFVRSHDSLDAAQSLTGHKSVQQLEIYAQVDKSKQKKAQSLMSEAIFDVMECDNGRPFLVEVK